MEDLVSLEVTGGKDDGNRFIGESVGCGQPISSKPNTMDLVNSAGSVAAREADECRGVYQRRGRNTRTNRVEDYQCHRDRLPKGEGPQPPFKPRQSVFDQPDCAFEEGT